MQGTVRRTLRGTGWVEYGRREDDKKRGELDGKMQQRKETYFNALVLGQLSAMTLEKIVYGRNWRFTHNLWRVATLANSADDGQGLQSQFLARVSIHDDERA